MKIINDESHISTLRHIATLERRLKFLQKRIDRISQTTEPNTHDLAERNALLWALAELEKIAAK